MLSARQIEAHPKGKTHTGSVKNTPNIKPKDLVGIPWMLAFALRADGWYLRQDIIWSKPNPMPESVTDRCTKSHEYIFLLSKSKQYYYDQEAIYEAANYDGRSDTMFKGSKKYANGFAPEITTEQSTNAKGHERWRTRSTFGNRNGEHDKLHSGRAYESRSVENEYIRNKRSVWTVITKPYSGAHFATFPEELICDCIKAGSAEGDVVIDPFMGAGTTALVSKKLNRQYLGIELNPEYIKLSEKRLQQMTIYEA